jgi:hypothetical protein
MPDLVILQRADCMPEVVENVPDQMTGKVGHLVRLLKTENNPQEASIPKMSLINHLMKIITKWPEPSFIVT